MQCCVFISGNESGTESDLTWIHPFRDRDRMPSALLHHSIVHQSMDGYDPILIYLIMHAPFAPLLLFSLASLAAASSLGVAGSCIIYLTSSRMESSIYPKRTPPSIHLATQLNANTANRIIFPQSVHYLSTL